MTGVKVSLVILFTSLTAVFPLPSALAGEEVISPPSTSDWTINAMVPGPSDRPNHPVDRFSISLSKAFEMSYVQNPDIVSGRKNINVALAQIKAAGARPNPQFAMQYGFGTPYTGTVSGNTQMMGINQLIETGGKRRARLRYARANYILAEYQLADLRYDTRSAVRKGYAELAAAEANIDLVESQRVLVQRLSTIAQKKYKAGTSEEVELLQSRLAVDQFDALRHSAFDRLRRASIELDYLLGFDPNRDLDVEDNGLFKLSLKRTELVPPPDEPAPPVEKLVELAFAERPDLKTARQEAVAAQRGVTLAKVQAIPDVLLGSGFVFSTYNQPPQQAGAYLNVNVDIPILYRHQGEIAAAKATQKQAELEAVAMAQRVEVDVRTAYSSLTAARANLAHFQKNLIPLALDVVRKAQDSYEKDKTDLGSALVAQQQFQNTFSNYFDTVVEYQNAWADLETAIGKPLDF